MTLDDPLPIALALMAIESNSGHEAPVVGHAEALLVAQGWTTTRIPVTEGRFNLFATTGVDPIIVFSTHLDTVPPYLPPRVEGEMLYGRGACDAKGIAAAMMVAAEQLRTEGVAVGLLFLVGEETTHDGATAANAYAPSSVRVLINGEPTESTLAIGTKGAIRLVVRTTGHAAHSAYPDYGRSAIHDLVRLLSDLERLKLPQDPVLGPTTVNIGHISGGVADNVFAPAAEARLMARLVAPANDFYALIEQWVAGRASIERGIEVPPVLLGTLPGYPTSVAAFATDIPKLTKWGRPYLYGPGSIHVAHTDREHITIAELRAAPAVYVRLAREALAAEG